MLLNHNIGVYEEMVATLNKSNCCCVVMGTGVGKTYVATEYLDNNNFKALVVSPRTSINEAWQRHTKRVETVTYQKLANIYKELDFSKYDVVICDEVHHIGAPTWGKPIKHIIDNKIIPVIGLTESSVRYADGGRDVAQEFFYNNVAFGETVPSAIEKQILNPVTYVGAMYNSDGLKKTLRGKVQSRLYAKLNLALNKTPTVTEIIKKNMPVGKRKGIIFASTIDDIKFAMDFLKTIYPNVRIEFVHSKQSDAINEKVMNWFNHTKEGYLCSVDMISEGVHIKGVNTLIMLRRTESVNLFNQQLGRCLDARSREPAILFDLVNNKYSIRIVKNKLRIKSNSILESGKINVVPSEQLIIKDYTKDIVEVLKEIQDSLSPEWPKQDIEILKQYYPEEGVKVRARLTSEYSNSAIICKASKLGIRYSYRSEQNLWTDEEIEIVKKHFMKDGLQKTTKLLPGRTTRQVYSKAKLLGLSNPSHRFLTDKDIEFIKENYPNKGNMYCANALGTTRETIKNYVRKLGLKNHALVSWTEEENEILREYYPKEGLLVANRLPGRKPYSCKTQANKLGIRRK